MLRLTAVPFLAAAALAAIFSPPATAQTTLTMSSWVSPTHPLTKGVLAVWGEQVEKATNGRVKLQMLPKAPSAYNPILNPGAALSRRNAVLRQMAKLDYVPADTVNSERAKFWLLHSAYLGCEALKYGVGLVLLATIMRRGRSVDPVNKFDMVDKANHRHVNG